MSSTAKNGEQTTDQQMAELGLQQTQRRPVTAGSGGGKLKTPMVTASAPCPSCGREVTAGVGARFADGELVWHASYSCPHCGAQIEFDETGVPPEDIRRAILAEEGEWSLTVPEPAGGTSEVTRALKALRHALGLSLAQAGELRGRLPGTVAMGTKAEMECLRSALASEGVAARVAPAGPASSAGERSHAAPRPAKHRTAAVANAG